MRITLVIKELKKPTKYMIEVRACGKTNYPPSSEYNLSNSGILQLQTYSCERCLLAVIRMESV